MVPMEALKRPQARALEFLLNEVTCERAFQIQGSIASKMIRFLHIFFLNVHHRNKSVRISLNISPNVAPNLEIMPRENDTDTTKS